MVLLNFIEETEDVATVSRYNGGWLKTVTGLDKSVTNGFSIEGQFVKAGNYKMDYSYGLYLDCSKDGSRKNQVWNYHLFRVDDDGFHLLQTVEDGSREWACEFWERIEEEMDGGYEYHRRVNAKSILNGVFERTKDRVILGEVADKLDDYLGRNKKYLLSSTVNRCASKRDFEGFLNVVGLVKLTSEDLDAYESDAVESVVSIFDGVELSSDEWDDNLNLAKLCSFLGVGFDLEMCDYSDAWYSEFADSVVGGKFAIGGYYYECSDCEYILVTVNKSMGELSYAKVSLLG